MAEAMTATEATGGLKKGRFRCSFLRTVGGKTSPCTYVTDKKSNLSVCIAKYNMYLLIHLPISLQTHVSCVHAKERPFTCELCNTGFKLKSHLVSLFNHLVSLYN